LKLLDRGAIPIVIGMAIPATSRGCEKDTSSADLTIKVTGMQWKRG
jgi:heme/copper-type cytochrome/quinol oxidase subunit 2